MALVSSCALNYIYIILEIDKLALHKKKQKLNKWIITTRKAISIDPWR